MSARALLALVEEIEELVGSREQRVVCYRNDQPEPIHDDNDIVICTVAEDPDPTQIIELHREHQRIVDPLALEFAPPPPPEPLPVVPMFVAPLPEPPQSAPLRDLPSLAAGAGLFATEDGPAGSGLWLLMSGKSVLFCGPERGARRFLADRAERPVHRRTPLGSR